LRQSDRCGRQTSRESQARYSLDDHDHHLIHVSKRLNGPPAAPLEVHKRI
jgi:hypothetical protein